MPELLVKLDWHDEDIGTKMRAVSTAIDDDGFKTAFTMSYIVSASCDMLDGINQLQDDTFRMMDGKFTREQVNAAFRQAMRRMK